MDIRLDKDKDTDAIMDMDTIMDMDNFQFYQ